MRQKTGILQVLWNSHQTTGTSTGFYRSTGILTGRKSNELPLATFDGAALTR